MPIRWRLTLFNALVIGVILLALGLTLFLLLRSALRSGLEDSVRSGAVTAARAAAKSGELEKEDAEELAPDGGFIVVRKYGRSGGGLSRADRFVPNSFFCFAFRREVYSLQELAVSVPDDHGDSVKGKLLDVGITQSFARLDGLGGRDRSAPGGVLDVVEQRAPAQEVEREAQDEQDRTDRQRDKERQAPPDRQGRPTFPSGRTPRPGLSGSGGAPPVRPPSS